MRTPPAQSNLRHFAGWSMLLAYVIALTGLLPMILGTAATTSGHEVRISAAHGDWEMVLSHHDVDEDHSTDHQDASEDDDHHHGPDHIIRLSPIASHPATALIAPKIALVVEWQQICPVPEYRIYPLPVYLNRVAARPPPGKPAWLVCLRTTMLIV